MCASTWTGGAASANAAAGQTAAKERTRRGALARIGLQKGGGCASKANAHPLMYAPPGVGVGPAGLPVPPRDDVMAFPAPIATADAVERQLAAFAAQLHVNVPHGGDEPVPAHSVTAGGVGGATLDQHAIADARAASGI